MLAGWQRPPTQLEWLVQRDGVDVTVSLHGCDYIRDWERPSGWKLPKDKRAALHGDFVVLFGELLDDLELTATWTDDPVDQALEMSRADFLGRVLTNQIANRTTYRIASAVGGGSRTFTNAE